ncbi:MAG: lipoprotein N-acyltransferase Lnb domain-containing protein [Gemmatimonadaceae bacterium]
MTGRLRPVLLLVAATLAAGAPRMLRGQDSSLTVEVITWAQGEPVWERFGHNAIRIRDARTGSDLAYNWGMFDFNQPNFVGRFLTGDTKYWMEPTPTALMVQFYQRLGRPATIQRLSLTPAQAARLQQFVEWNAREENKWYRYDYFLDNCSTRLRDALDRALGGQLRRAWEGDTTTHTFRSEALRLVEGMPVTQQGMDIALGRPADRAMTAWEEAYVPMRLRDRLRTVRVADANGAARPLVASEYEVAAPSHVVEAPVWPRHDTRNLVIGTLVGLLFAVSAGRIGRDRRWGALLGGVGSLWAVATGGLGVILLLAWTMTRHHFWYANENLLLVNPVTLPLALLLPLAVARPRWSRAAFALALLGALLAILALLLKLLPGAQQNLGVIMLLLPMHLGMLVATGFLRSRHAAAEPG